MGDSGLIRRSEAARAGLTDSALRQLGRANKLVRVRRGAYLDAEALAQLDDVQRHAIDVRSALGDHSDGTVVSHASAAVIWGLPTWGVALDAVHLTKPRRSAGRRQPGLHVHTAPLDVADVVRIDGVRVTSAARTVFDLACQLPFEVAVAVTDAALHTGLISKDDLSPELDAGVGRWGRQQAMLAVRFADGRSESVGESRSRVGMHRAGLPMPDLQRSVISAAGEVIGRADFDWAPVPLLGEFDGLIKYSRYLRPGETAADALLREKIREDALRALGYLLIRWIWAELNHPERLYPRLRAALDRAARLPRVS